MAKCTLVYGGEQREYHDGIEVIGAIEFFKRLPQILSKSSDVNSFKIIPWYN